MLRRLVIAATGGALILPLASGCTTYRETQPAHTATEQLLTNHAAEIAAEKLAGALPPQSAVFLDLSHFKGDNADYAISAIDDAFAHRGIILVADKKTSKLTVELRMGALSIDQEDTVFGLPATTLPIPGTLTAFPIPEISFYSAAHRTGVAEFSAFAYDTATGAPVAFTGPVAGQRKLVQRHILTVFGFGSRVEPPGPPPKAP
ncbi:MAG: DUF6655 family protein [Caulobacteraceae bacterium]